MVIDGSKIILPDTKENESIFGQLNTSKQQKNAKDMPVGGLLSTLHDCLNNVFLDVQFGPCYSSEDEFASKLIDEFCPKYSDKAIFTFDRGYPSMKLVTQLIKNNQFFLFRLPSNFLKSYTEKLQNGEDKVIDVTFDSKSTNYYREDIQFRQYLMNTTFHLRFTKIIIGKDDDDQDIVEILMSNLPKEEYNMNDLMELYHLRWTVETSYNRLKNRMMLEEFSRFKPILIYQDIYSDIWLYNLISLKIIEMDERAPIEQTLVMMDKEITDNAVNIIDDNILANLIWIKKSDPTQGRRPLLHPLCHIRKPINQKN